MYILMSYNKLFAGSFKSSFIFLVFNLFFRSRRQFQRVSDMTDDELIEFLDDDGEGDGSSSNESAFRR